MHVKIIKCEGADTLVAPLEIVKYVSVMHVSYRCPQCSRKFTNIYSMNRETINRVKVSLHARKAMMAGEIA